MPTAAHFLQWSHAARQRYDRAVQFLVDFCAGWNISAESGGTRRGRRLGIVPDADGDGQIRDRDIIDIVDKTSRFHGVGGSRDRLALFARSVSVDRQHGNGNRTDLERSRQADSQHERNHRRSHHVPERPRAGQLSDHRGIHRIGRQNTKRRDQLHAVMPASAVAECSIRTL